jgi:hypothetical protein
MSRERVEKLTKALDSRLNEFLDGYALMGFVAGTGEPIVIFRPGDQKTTLALNTLIASSLGQMGAWENEE